MNILKVKGKEYILKYNFRALSELQDRGISLTIEQEFRLKDIVTLIQIGLKKFHPELDTDAVFDLMDDILEEMSLEDLLKDVAKSLEEAMGKQKPSPKK